MVKPFITFKGDANEAINFYEKVFNGTDKKVMHYGDMPSNSEFPVRKIGYFMEHLIFVDQRLCFLIQMRVYMIKILLYHLA